MNKTTIYSNVKYDELKLIELNLNSLLLVRSNDLNEEMIDSLRKGLKNISFQVPIIGMDMESTLEDMGTDQLIDMVLDIANRRADLKEKLKSRLL